MQPVAPWHMVNPLGIGIIVPHFPEEGGQQDAQPQGNDRAPVAAPSPTGEGTVAHPDVDRLENEIHGKPDEREKSLRPDQHQGEHDPACEEEQKGCPFVRADF